MLGIFKGHNGSDYISLPYDWHAIFSGRIAQLFSLWAHKLYAILQNAGTKHGALHMKAYQKNGQNYTRAQKLVYLASECVLRVWCKHSC